MAQAPEGARGAQAWPKDTQGLAKTPLASIGDRCAPGGAQEGLQESPGELGWDGTEGWECWEHPGLDGAAYSGWITLIQRGFPAPEGSS